jgi:predicted thioesterase
MSKENIAVSLATLESHNHIVGDIERGVNIYERGGVEFVENFSDDLGLYIARVPHKNDSKTVSLRFTRDGMDLAHHHCDCCWNTKSPPICRHKVAAVLAIQGGIPKTNLVLGKKGIAETVVTEQNTAKAAGSGSLDVFATPMMIALMEQAACNALAGALDDGQTSVGTGINIQHTAATPIDMKVTTAAVITSVSGRSITFEVSAADETGEIGSGTHTRAIIDEERFMKKVRDKGCV